MKPAVIKLREDGKFLYNAQYYVSYLPCQAQHQVCIKFCHYRDVHFGKVRTLMTTKNNLLLGKCLLI